MWISLALLLVVIWLLVQADTRRKALAAAALVEYNKELETAFSVVGHLESLSEIPQPPISVVLQRGEVCYFTSDATWHEYRTRTKRISYGGPVASIRIAKGLHYRVGSITPVVEKTSELTTIDSGMVYLTNKRVVFDGNERNFSVPWKSVISVTPFQGGFEVGKKTGRSPHLHIAGNPTGATAIAVRAHEEGA